MCSARVLIADDHELLLEMFQAHLEQSPDLTVRVARSLDEAVGIILSEGVFDLVLLDLNMPGMNGLEGLRRGLEVNGGQAVALLTGDFPVHLLSEVNELGAAGVVLKTLSLRSLDHVLRFMMSGEKFFPSELLAQQKESRSQAASPLSEKEQAVLVQLSSGLSNRDIAQSVGLAESTIKMYVKSICRKLNAKNRTQAVIVAQGMGLV